MRTILFFTSVAVAMFAPILKISLNIFRRALVQMLQFFRLPSVQPRRDCERRIHPHYAGLKVEFRYPFKTARGTFLDAHAASLAVVHQNLVEPVRTHIAHDARLRADQITVVASVASATAETAVGFFNGLFFGVRLNHLFLRFSPAGRRQKFLLHTGEVWE